MIGELKKCKEDIIYFAENFFYIVSLDRGKEKIQLYEAQKRVLRSFVSERNVIVCSSRQIGKALALDTPIPTESGWKTMGTLTNKDRVFGANGKLIKITDVHDIMEDRPCYKVTFSTGETIVADEEHEWFTQSWREASENKIGSVKTTKQIFDTLEDKPDDFFSAHRILRSQKGILGSLRNLFADPYVVGLWLGNGEEDPKWTNNLASKQIKQTFAKIKENKSFKSKRIPNDYFLSSREQRINLLTGLIDAQGNITEDGSAVFYSDTIPLQEDIVKLLKELGYVSSTFVYKNPKGKIWQAVKFVPNEIVTTRSSKKIHLKLETEN